MKRILAGLAVGLLLPLITISAFAQGSITFGTFNGATTTQGQVFLPASLGGGGAGTDYVGQLYWSDTADGTFAALGTPVTFAVGVPAGYLTSGSVFVSGRDAGTTLFFQIRVWNSTAGSSYETALTSPELIASGITEAKSRRLAGVDPDGNIFTPQKVNHLANLTLTAAAPSSPPPPPALTSTVIGDNLVLTWSGPAVLEAAGPDCTTFSEVVGASSPYTNCTTSATQQFFRLRN